ncbi:MAG TPA: MerR family transcriptional regulator [Aggregatilineales bacterium]|nr:MerR family transcriptional regulator [Aggregatilineales bacterium]
MRTVETTFTIQEVATATGLSEHTLRYYERIGLIEEINRAENGHRRYSSSDIGWIEFLKKLRATGMQVAQMQCYADYQRQGDHTLGDRIDLLKEHRQAVINQIENLQAFLSVLDYKIDYYTEEQEKLELAT